MTEITAEITAAPDTQNAEVEAEKASLRDTAKHYPPDAELSLYHWCLDDARTKRDRKPDEFTHCDWVRIRALEALVAEMEREAKP
jgi:hypothetical protein